MSIEVFNESGVGVNEESLIDVARYALGRMDVHPAALSVSASTSTSPRFTASPTFTWTATMVASSVV